MRSKKTVKFPAGDLGKILPLEMPLKKGILQKISLGSIFDKAHGSNLSKVVALKMSFLCKITCCQNVTFWWLPVKWKESNRI